MRPKHGDSSSPATTDSSAAHGNLTFCRVVRLSLKGRHFDFTSVPLNRAVILLAVPMVLEMIMESPGCWQTTFAPRPTRLFISIPVSLSALAGSALCRRGRWKQLRV